MLGFEPSISGFSTWAAEGHGFGFANASVSEHVRGRVKRQVITAVLDSTTAGKLLDTIERDAAVPHLTYWIEPVERFGRMQRTAPTCTTSQTFPGTDEQGSIRYVDGVS